MKLKFFVLLALVNMVAIAQTSYWEKSVIKDYEEGVNLFDKQLFAAATDKFVNVIQSGVDPKSEIYVGSDYHRAMCAMYLFNKDAEALVEQFIKNNPTSTKVQEAKYNTANFMFTRGKYRQAAEWLEKLDQRQLKAEEKEAYHFKYGYSLLMRKEERLAKDQFYQIKENNSKYGTSARYYYAHLAYADSNYVTALENFEPLLDDASFGKMVPFYLAQIYYKTGDYDKLISTGEQLVNQAESARTAEIAKLVGEAYFRKNNYKKALVYFEKYKDGKGKMLQADYYTLGYCYYKTGDYENALQAFNKITGARGAVGQSAYYHLADCYLKLGNKQEAMSAFKAASEIEGADESLEESASFNYAKLNYELSNPYEDAIKALNRFVEKYPNSINKSDAHKYLANLYITTKDYENALSAIAETGLKTPEMREAYQKVSYFRGVEHYNALEHDQAIELFTQSLKYPINGTYIALAHYWTAESYFKQKKYDEALKSYWSFQQTPGASNLSEYALSHYNKGYCFFMQEDFKNSAYSFRLFIDEKKAKQRLKDDASLRLGDSYFMTGKYASAVQYYNTVAGTKKSDADYAQFQKALCLGLEGKNKEKIATLNSLVKQYPGSNYLVDARYQLGATSLRIDENNAALNYFNDFLEYHPNSQMAARVMLNKGIIYRNLNEYGKAIDIFKTIVEKYPATTEANEAISFAKLVYAKDNKIEEYVDWVEGISFADVKRASLDSTVYTTAYDLYGMGNCPDAITAFEKYLNKFADGLFVLKAQNYIAECSYNAKEDVKAETYYKLVIAHPKNEYTELAMARLAGINFAKENYTQALEYYEKLTSMAEDVNRLRMAYKGILQSANHLGLHEKTVQYADIIIADDKFEPEVRNQALLFKSRAYWSMGEINKAWQAFTELQDVSQGAAKAEATYYIAKIENMNGEFEKSNKSIFWMIDNLPSYAKWRFKALLILSDNYWKMDDAFQANYTLDFVISENYSPEIVAEAKKMKEDIKRIEEQKKLDQEKAFEKSNEINLNLQEQEKEEEESAPDEILEPQENEDETNETTNH